MPLNTELVYKLYTRGNNLKAIFTNCILYLTSCENNMKLCKIILKMSDK